LFCWYVTTIHFPFVTWRLSLREVLWLETTLVALVSEKLIHLIVTLGFHPSILEFEADVGLKCLSST
jgi:hypothetical protein